MTEIEVGVCARCSRELLRTADDCWHPWSVLQDDGPCPYEPGLDDDEELLHWYRNHPDHRTGRPPREWWRPRSWRDDVPPGPITIWRGSEAHRGNSSAVPADGDPVLTNAGIYLGDGTTPLNRLTPGVLYTVPLSSAATEVRRRFTEVAEQVSRQLPAPAVHEFGEDL